MKPKFITLRLHFVDGVVYEPHHAHCAENIVEQRKRERDWLKKWPNYCEKCNGTGILSVPGSSVPYGYGPIHLPDDQEPCNECLLTDDILKMRCPRCGEELYNVIVDEYEVPAEKQWLVDEPDGFGTDGIIEAWLEDPNPCPLCGWNNGANGDDYFPNGDGCLCHETEDYDYFDVSKPSRVQRAVFFVFRGLFQSLWSVPIMDVPKRR